MEFEYKVSVIVPVYNAQQYLEECLDSILGQSMAQGDMEVLLVNDGSSDDSLEICERYAAAHENFTVLSQENQGVSAARNNGIRHAKGKYLLYLDGDDTLGPQTIENVTTFFDEHYDEVDVVGYPILFCYENGVETPHARDKILKTTDVYHVDQTLYINLTTINVMVKNRGAENILFSQELFYHEDEDYLARAVMAQHCFGYVREAQYRYRKHGNGISDQMVSPYYIFEPTMQFYEHLFATYQQNGQVEPYIQTILLNDLNWKIKQDCVFPYHYSETEFQRACARVVALVDQLDNDLVMGHPYMNEAHKFYLLSLKSKDRPFFQLWRNHRGRKTQMLLRDEEGELDRHDRVQLVVRACKVEGDSLYILAYLKEFCFSFLEKPGLYALVNGEERVDIPLYLSQHSCFWSNIQTNTFWGFSFEIDLKTCESLEFFVDIQGTQFETRYYFSDSQGIQPNFQRRYVVGRDHLVYFKRNMFYTLPVQSPEARQMRKDYERYLFKNHKKQWLVRRYAHKKPGRTIWLYEDTYNAVDNAYYQFLHDLEQDDGVERYYICDKEELDWERYFTPAQGKRLVARGSKKHKRLFLQADKILTSFVGWIDYIPFDRHTILYYWDLLQFDVIYLQHGIMHAQLPNMYSKEKLPLVDKVVASTGFERDNLIGKLAFREKDVICSGMPRLDRLKEGEREKRILFAPSWRSYLVNTGADGKRLALPGFEDTDYFQELKAFLTDPRLQALLEKKGYVLEIKLHPNFGIYHEQLTALCSQRVILVDEAPLEKYAAFLTDFSSFMYDCFYLDTPVLTHIFDRDRFRGGLHTYRELCWPMETQYPYYCKEPADMIRMLERLTDDPVGFSREFARYTEGMFLSRDRRHAQRVYDALTGE